MDAMMLALLRNATNFPVTNLVQNGDFSQGETGWVLEAGCTISDGALSLSMAVNARVYELLPIVTNHKYYCRCDVKNVSGTTGSVRAGLHDGTDYIGDMIPIPTSAGYASGVIVPVSACDRLRFGRVSAGDRVFTVDNVLCVDLTGTFGEGNEPSNTECDTIFARWFDGTKNPYMTPLDMLNYMHKELTKIKTVVVMSGGTV
jgi:hypothetical protein